MRTTVFATSSTNSTKGYLSINLFPKESIAYLRDYLCSICNGVYYKPCVTSCGHIFCEECIQGEIKKNGQCPCCHTKTSDMQVMSIYSIENIIGKNQIHCKNVANGCTWFGMISELDLHFKSCVKQTVPCPNPGCRANIFKSILDVHLNECEYSSEKCEFCGVGFFSKKKKEHCLICPKMKIPCTLGCEDFMVREEMGDHQDLQCRKKILDCPFSQLGCKEPLERERHETHQKESESEHLFMLLTDFEEIKSRSQKIEEVVYGMKISENSYSKRNNTNNNSLIENIDIESKTLKKKRLRSYENSTGKSEKLTNNPIKTKDIIIEIENNATPNNIC